MTQPPVQFDPSEEFGDRRVPCPECGYDMRGVACLVCPECGASVAMHDLRANPDHAVPRRIRRRTEVYAAIGGALAVGGVIAYLLAPGSIRFAGAAVTPIGLVLIGSVVGRTKTASVAQSARSLAMEMSRRPSSEETRGIREAVAPFVKCRQRLIRTAWLARGTIRGRLVLLASMQIPINTLDEDHNWTLAAVECPRSWPSVSFGQRRKHHRWRVDPLDPRGPLSEDAAAMTQSTTTDEYWICNNGWLLCLRAGPPQADGLDLLAHRPVEMLRLLERDGAWTERLGASSLE